jgi:hypothetical protein
VSLTGSGALTSTAIQQYLDAAALSGSGVLAAAAAATVPAAVTLTGSGVLSATSLVRLSDAVALTGAGSLTVSAAVVPQDAVALSGSGTLTSAATQQFPCSVALTGSGTLSVTAVVPSVTYDATGGGYHGTSTSPSWTHVVGSSANALVVAVMSTSYQPSAVTYNGMNLTFLTVSTPSSVSYFGTIFYINFYGLLSPSTGSHSVAVTMAGSGYFAMNSFSYSNVTGFGTPVGNSGTGGTTTASVTISSATTQMVAAAFISCNAGGSMGSPSTGTSRYNQTFSSGVNYPSSYADATGASSVTISETAASGSYWAAAGLPIL